MGEEVGHVHDDEQQVEREPERDDRERFQDADAEEQEREDVRARFGLTSDRLDGLRRDDAVADGRTERDAEHDQPEREERRSNNQASEVKADTFHG